MGSHASIGAVLFCGAVGMASLAGCMVGSGEPVVDIADNDPEMQQATAEARANLDVFVEHLAARPDDMSALLKAPLDTGGQIEHLWIDSVIFDGEQFTGRLANRPQDRSKYKQGDQVSVPKADISDWTFLDGDALRGGYTVKAMEKRGKEPRTK